MDVRFGPQRRLSQEELMLSNVVLEKTLESPLDCKETKLVDPKVNPEYSLEGLIRKLKLQYFGHMMRRADSLKRP